ncbi:MAG: amidase family protein [Hyphomicrobiales bacterium]|nr:amidase family protein [Hyphomicrobiales bacterium]
MIKDTVGAFVPHGLFRIEGASGGPLEGLTFAAKDLFDVAGHPTSGGNPTWLATHPVPDVSSPIVDALLDAGATLVGKTITDELAYSLHGDNMHYGAPLNAAAPDRVTGGSSSGSVAAVAAHLVDFALGTDTGGSTRVPASYCGVWGLRTTHGALSGAGLVPLHRLYDTPTWFAHDADTFACVGDVLMPASDHAPSRAVLLRDVAALADPVFSAPLGRVVAALEQMFGAVTPLDIAEGQQLADWRAAYGTSGGHEGWQLHGDWITQNKPVFAPAIAARWKAASEISDEAGADARAKAAAVRAHVRSVVGVDTVAVLPSAASLAPLRNADPAEVDAVRLRTMAITCVAGIAGLPQVSMPFLSAEGVPVGISLMGPAGSDAALIRLAVKIHASVQGT